MHVHILGICGTFMGSLALLARDLGYTVTGSDKGIYPPMSTQLERAGVTIQEGYLIEHLQPAPDLVIVGNAMSRGNPAVEYMLNEGIAYTSGPQFLSEQVLQHRHVLAVAGTHGKTTTTTMLAWVLQYCGIDTGFLIGGVPLINSDDARLNTVFAHSSYLGAEQRLNPKAEEEDDSASSKKGYFVIEADEYDSAFFDKRSKFVHYRPRTAILNNLEFDHADIFRDLDAIQTQFYHLIRMIPSNGQIIMPANTQSLEETITKGCWTPIWRTTVLEETNELSQAIATDSPSVKESASPVQWQAELQQPDGSHFSITFVDAKGNAQTADVKWGMSGRHNVENALVTVAAAVDVGIPVVDACAALSQFAGIKRRMELIGDFKLLAEDGHNQVIKVYDDFAHHPTAITTTLDGASKHMANADVWAVIEPRSNTMKLGIYKDNLAQSAALADHVLWYEPASLAWGLKEVISNTLITNHQMVLNDTQSIIDYLVTHITISHKDAIIIIMSNGGFENIHQRLLEAITA